MAPPENSSALQQPLLLAPLRGRPRARPPIWLMRQAGRYLPEYREVRSQAASFLELCYTPALAVEITLQPVRRFGMDAAILFSDILVVADALGCPVDFIEGTGPQLRPVRTEAAVAGLSRAQLGAHLAPVYQALRELRRILPQETALIGFAGAPWTVAAYMVEGEAAKEFYSARSFARRAPETFAQLIDLLTEATIVYLHAQIEAGADVLQLFDSWAGVLPQTEFVRWCQEPTARIVRSLKKDHPEVPIIAFPRGAGLRYQSFAEAVPVDGLSLDTTVPLDWARRALPGICLQGNLDPAALLAGGACVRAEAERILRAFRGAPFIFNLGHGVLPETDPAEVAALVAYVKSFRRAAAADESGAA
jgi:uroporphyrinogen decarboxylase